MNDSDVNGNDMNDQDATVQRDARDPTITADP